MKRSLGLPAKDLAMVRERLITLGQASQGFPREQGINARSHGRQKGNQPDETLSAPPTAKDLRLLNALGHEAAIWGGDWRVRK